MSNPNKQPAQRRNQIGVKEILATAGVAAALGGLVIHNQVRTSAPEVGPINGPHREYVWKDSDRSLLTIAQRAYGPEKALDAEWDMEHKQGLEPGSMQAGEVVMLSEDAKIGTLVESPQETAGSGPDG